MSRTVLIFLAGCFFFMGLGFQLGKINPQAILRESIAESNAVVAVAVADATSVSRNLAYEESLHFFDDIEDQEWELIKRKVREIQPNTKGSSRGGRGGAGPWFQSHYEPDFACRHERRIGKLGDGGKWVCDPHRLQGNSQERVRPSCLVYSVGSNGDPSFELAVKTSIGHHCEVHTFDMDNYSHVVEPTGAIYHQWGLSDKTESKKDKRNNDVNHHEYKTLADTVKLLGHQNRTIDIFKIDCEGCEWPTWQSWFDAKVPIRQILIEVHENEGGQVPRPEAPDFFNGMYEQGYVIFHKEPNIQFWKFRKCVEYAFLLLNQTFFDDDNGKSWLKLK